MDEQADMNLCWFCMPDDVFSQNATHLLKLYFFGYKVQVFPYQSNPQNLEVDLEFWEVLDGKT